MAVTRAQDFYSPDPDIGGPRPQDGGWGSNVQGMLDDYAGLTSNGYDTVNVHPNSAGTTIITASPFVNNRSTQGDVSSSHGWAWNAIAASLSSMGSVAGALRWIRPGVWVFSASLNIPAGGTVTGSHNVTLTWRVYRVGPAPTYTRTLLFSAVSAEFSGGLLGANNTVVTTNSPSQPEIILQPGETLHVGLISSNRQVAGLLGATTSGAIPIRHNNGGVRMFRVPAPGIGTLAITQGISVGSSGSAGSAGIYFSGVGLSAGDSAALGYLGAFSGAVTTIVGSATIFGSGGSFAGITGTAIGDSLIEGNGTMIFAGAGMAVGDCAVDGFATAIFSGVGASAGNSDVAGFETAIFSGVGNATGDSLVAGFGSSVAGTVGSAAGDSIVDGQMSKVLGTVGTVSVAEGGGPVNTYIFAVLD